MKQAMLCSVLALLITGGCEEDRYVLEMTADGPTVTRTLTISRKSDKKPVPFPKEKLAKISTAYPAGSLTTEGLVHTLRARFEGAMPRDLANAGTFTVLADPMGRVSQYIERFGGNNDVAASLQAQLNAADTFTDLLIGWMSAEFSASADLPKIRAFLDGPFRKDIRNLVVFARYAEVAGRRQSTTRPASDNPVVSPAGQEGLRVVQYLIEHGYLTSREGLSLVASWGNSGGDRVFDILQRRIFIERPGVTDKTVLAQFEEWSRTPKAMNESFEKYLATTPAYRKKLEEYERQAASQPATQPAKKPAPHSVLDDTVEAMGVFLPMGHGGPAVTVSFKGQGTAVITNGRIDPETGSITWNFTLDEDQTPGVTPSLCQAAFAQADTAFQTRHFGKVVLAGKRLMAYLAWHDALNADDAKQWDAFIETLKPRDDLVTKLGTFRFADERAAQTQPATQPGGRAEPALHLILESLQEKQQEPREMK